MKENKSNVSMVTKEKNDKLRKEVATLKEEYASNLIEQIESNCKYRVISILDNHAKLGLYVSQGRGQDYDMFVINRSNVDSSLILEWGIHDKCLSVYFDKKGTINIPGSISKNIDSYIGILKEICKNFNKFETEHNVLVSREIERLEKEEKRLMDEKDNLLRKISTIENLCE